LQSKIAPSAKKTIKHINPKKTTARFGQVKPVLSSCLSSSEWGNNLLYWPIEMASRSTEMVTAATTGERPTLISAPNPKDPNNPPTLNRPWKEDIMCLPYNC